MSEGEKARRGRSLVFDEDASGDDMVLEVTASLVQDVAYEVDEEEGCEAEDAFKAEYEAAGAVEELDEDAVSAAESDCDWCDSANSRMMSAMSLKKSSSSSSSSSSRLMESARSLGGVTMSKRCARQLDERTRKPGDSSTSSI